MTRRPGMSLTEVLVALFILALGVIAILTLFPLGAAQMAVAVREDRGALAAFDADGYMRAYWKTEVAEKGTPTEAFFTALDNPGKGLTDLRTTSDLVSYPVIVDPMGYVSRSGTAANWFGDGGVTYVPRQNLQLLGTSTPYAMRVCSLMDGLGYDEYGAPTQERELRYNWLWIIQRTNNANKTAANMTVVVFDRRAPLYAPTGSEAVFGVAAATGAPVAVAPGQLAPGVTSISLAGSPDLKPGGFIMDATIGTDVTGKPVRHANLYRVLRAVQNGTNMDVDLETPIRRTDGLPDAYNATVVVVRGVSGVYTRPPLLSNE